MKKILIFVLAAAGIAACNSEDKNAGPQTAEERIMAMRDSANFTSIEWLDSTLLNLGKVKEGTIVEVSYRFKNSGSKNLVIEDVAAACGCTVPEKPERAFAPGEEGVIKAKFDSRGRVGTNNKYVTVTSNTTPSKQHTLHFTVEVTQ
jgi:hypothetical protein